MVILRSIVCLIVVLYVSAALFLIIQSLFEPFVYQKDFIQEYLMARAVISGVDPYIPLPDLADVLLGPLPVTLLPHPNVHPPAGALLSLPFGLLEYQTAAMVWLIFEFICLAGSAYLLLRHMLKKVKPVYIFVSLTLLLLWSPVKDELSVGQLMSLLLLLLTGSWLTLRRNKDVWGGVLLGIVLSIKLIGWTIVLYLLLKRRWKAVFASGLIFILANGLSGILIGFDNVINYYLVVGSSAAALYMNHERNISVWTLGYRLFDGTYSNAAFSIEAPPMIFLPTIAPVISGIFVIGLLVIILWKTHKSNDFDLAYGNLICANIVLTPIAWSHYYILALIPLVILITFLIKTKLLNNYVKWFTLVSVTLFLAFGLRSAVLLLSGQSLVPTVEARTSFVVAIITYFLQVFPLIALIVLLTNIGESLRWNRGIINKTPKISR